ncbi:MAG: hypothetical protein ABIT37_14005 [Luteolibacter sp.]
MKTPITTAGLFVAGFSFFTGDCLALTPFSDNFTGTRLDKASWLPGNYGTGAILRQSGGRLNFSMPVAKAREVDIWLELIASRPGYNENWQAILDVVNTNSHRSNSSTGLWISNGNDPSDVVYLEFFGKGPKGGFGASFVVDGLYTAGADIVANPGVTKGSIRISFNKATKILTFWYDKTGSADGYKWTKLGTFATNGVGGDRRGNWQMNDEIGTFVIKLAGYVENEVVAQGTESMDNFVLKALK